MENERKINSGEIKRKVYAEKLVSIIIPCYNMEKYLTKCLDSILNQNYLMLEVIAVDDGSTDNTPIVLEDYKNIFNRKKISFKCIRKENGGSASAISVGLQYVTGKYLIWIDADDFLLPDSIKNRVKYMEENTDCGIVRGNGYIYQETDLSTPVKRISKIWKRNAVLEDFVKFIVPWCCGCYMVRMDVFDEVNPRRYIYDSPCGQNIQMVLPIVSSYPCHYLDENVYAYVIHSQSHSRQFDDYEKASKHIEDIKDCVLRTLDILGKGVTQYVAMHELFIRETHYKTAWSYGKKTEMKKYEAEMKEHGEFYIDHQMMKYIKSGFKVSKLIIYVSAFRRIMSK